MLFSLRLKFVVELKNSLYEQYAFSSYTLSDQDKIHSDTDVWHVTVTESIIFF